MIPSGASVVLKALLLPPALSPRLLSRPELVDRLVLALQARSALIVAGAGYGKSTLLAQAEAADGRPWLWLSCDDRIMTERSVLAHVLAALERRFPGVGSAVSLSGTVAENVTALCNEVVDTVPDDIVLAVDDIHLLSPAAADALRMLIHDLPPHVHLALASRRALPFATGRLRNTLELREEALALNLDEAVQLLDLLAPGCDKASAWELHASTEGWVSGLILAARAGSAPHRHRRVAHAACFDYLAEEVLSRQPERLRRFLVQSSVVDRFTPEIAVALTGRTDSREIISTLLDAHLFIQRLDLDGQWYRYHHLFQAFLRRAVSTSRPEAIALHRRAAAAWRAAGDSAMAVNHHLAAGDPLGAAEALEPVAEQMVTGPRGDQVTAWLAGIGSDLWSSRPALVLAHASLEFTQGEHAAGIAALERAAGQLTDAAEHDRAAVAFFRHVQAVTWAGAPRASCIRLGESVLPRIDPAADMLPAAHIMLSGAYAHVGRYDDAERELTTALERPGIRQFPVFRVYAAINRAYFLDFRRGHVDASAARLHAAIEELEARATEDVLVYRSWAASYYAVVLGYLGRWTDALDVVDAWPERAVQQGFGRLGGYLSTWHRLAHLPGLGRWKELDVELRRAEPLAARHPDTTYAYRYRSAAAQLAAHRGDPAATAREIASVRSTDQAPFPRAMVLADLALAAADVGLTSTATELSDAARVAAESIQAPWPQTRACLVGAAVATSKEHGDALLAEGLRLTTQWGYQELWSRRERPLAARLLAHALAHGIGPPGAAAHIAVDCGPDVVREAVKLLADAPAAARRQLVEAADAAGTADPAVLAHAMHDHDPTVRWVAERAFTRMAVRPRPPVRIVTLGGFAVQRRDAARSEVTFIRQKARTLLAVLLAGDGPVHREVLLEQLWPQLGLDRATAALHTTLHALRQSLSAGLGPRAVELVLTEGDQYRVALGPGDQWDAAELLGSVGGLQSDGPVNRLERALAAEACHTGPFLPEWCYEQWAQARRDDVERAYRSALVAVAEELMSAGRPGAALSRYERLLQLEPERESWHRGVMRAYAQTGERALALRQYHACRAQLRESLGVDPSSETQLLYASLL